MTGMKELSLTEMKSVKGGKCNSNYGYYFCCPADTAALQKKVAEYLAVSQDKASKYVQFCYEDCGFN